MSSNSSRKNSRLRLETLEDRTVLSVATSSLIGDVFTMWSDSTPSNVSVSVSGSRIHCSDSANGFRKTLAGVSKVQFVGGAANDTFVNHVSTLPVTAWGLGGHDYLQGGNAADFLAGGDGNDTLVGCGGDDTLWGEAGNDVLRGLDGNDTLYGGDGMDRLNGGAGNDAMYGGNGDDVLIAIDGGVGDTVQGDAGRDAIWRDKMVPPAYMGSYFAQFFALDSAPGLNPEEDANQIVDSFANGADRTLDGDRIGDPAVKSGHTYRRFSGNPLFGSRGPVITDINQGALGDCWLLAGLGAIANDTPIALRLNVVDFDDGTYGVRLGNNFYRVDDDLPVEKASWFLRLFGVKSHSTPVYAGFGHESSMWVAVVEKAFAHYHKGANSYASIAGSWSGYVNNAFGATAAFKYFNSNASSEAQANEMFTLWVNRESVTVGFSDDRYGRYLPYGLINKHAYSVHCVVKDSSSGAVTSIVLRNPWGIDTDSSRGALDGHNDGFVTLSAAQLFSLGGHVTWGRV